MIVIVDYGVGNLNSVQNMLSRAGAASIISSDAVAIRSASRLILPGVGHFGFAMEALHERGLTDVLLECAGAGMPLLGICLGAQLLGRGSEEADVPGLGLLPMETKRFDDSRLRHGEKVPHMGWAATRPVAKNSPLLSGLDEASRFYYVHSFHFSCDDPGMVLCTAEHGYEFPAGVHRGNVAGVQFHPEKSHTFGRQFLQNFATMMEH